MGAEKTFPLPGFKCLTSSPPSRFARRESGKGGDSFLPSPRLFTGMDREPERSGHRLGGSSLRTGASGVPRPENVFCGVDVRMIGVAAGDAPEGGLIRPVFRRDVAADETGPGRVPGINPDQTTSQPHQLNEMVPPLP